MTSSPLRVISCGFLRTSLELIRNWTMQVRRELVVFQHSFQNWNFRGGFGCGDEFSGVWMLATEVHLLPPWCARVLFPLPQPGVCSRHDGHWETVTLCPQKKKKKAGFCLCFAASFPVAFSPAGQVAATGVIVPRGPSHAFVAMVACCREPFWPWVSYVHKSPKASWPSLCPLATNPPHHSV